MKNLIFTFLVMVYSSWTLALPTALPKNTPQIIPVPKEVKMDKGDFTLSSSSLITFTDQRIEPLAKILSDNIFMFSGHRLKCKLTSPKAGNIILAFDDLSKTKSEAYRLSVSDRITLQAANYNALSAATSSLLMSLKYSKSATSIPCMKIYDYPDNEYRGMMLDLARYYHSMDILKQAVVLCKLYKIKFLHLHLTDRGRFVFPSTAYPKLTSKTKSYSLEEFNQLERFASQHGIILIPELDIPSHADSFVNGMPKVFKCDNGIPYTLNFASPKSMEVIETLVDEVCAVFKSSPYYHMGGDEIILPDPATNPDFKKAIEENNLRDCMDLYRLLINKMNVIAKKNGKQLIVWERFLNDPKSPVQIDKDVIVNEYAGHWFPADEIMAAGYSIINATGNPLYVVQNHKYPLNQIYNWSIYDWESFSPPYEPRHFYKVKPNPLIIGGQICSWEQPEHLIIPSLRKRVATFSERVWNTSKKVTFKDFAERLEHSDTVLNTLINPLMPSIKGLIQESLDYQRDYPRGFKEAAVVAFEPRIPGKIYYTLNKKEPTPKSKLYTEPLIFSDNLIDLKAKMFDAKGKAIGYTYDQQFALSILTVEPVGALPEVMRPKIGKLANAFTNTVTFTVKAAREFGSIRYTLNGRKPSIKSTKYTKPFSIDKTSTVRIQYFDEKRKSRGEEWRQNYDHLPFNINLATGKQTSISGTHKEGLDGSYAVDGWVILDKFWGNGPYPQWWQVDLEKVCELNKIELVFYFDGKRYYQYNVEASIDGKNWSKIIDKSKNTKISTKDGVTHNLKDVKARYIRVNLLKNSLNSGVHIVEFRAF